MRPAFIQKPDLACMFDQHDNRNSGNVYDMISVQKIAPRQTCQLMDE
jgi:hypothetical protein